MPNTSIFRFSWDILRVTPPWLCNVPSHLPDDCYKYRDPDNGTPVSKRLVSWCSLLAQEAAIQKEPFPLPTMDPPLPKKRKVQGSSSKPEPMDVDPPKDDVEPMVVDVPPEEETMEMDPPP